MKQLVTAALCVAAFGAWSETEPNGLVIVLTDLGADSEAVGAMKGAMYAKYPKVRIDAITNSIANGEVNSGAYVLADTAAEFPAGTTFCAVVGATGAPPPACVVLETNNGLYFVGPDNGLLSEVAREYGVAELRESDNPDLWRLGRVAHANQGRDIYGPVAASIARGVSLADVGPKLEELKPLEVGDAVVVGDEVRGVVLRKDTYGNLITNIKPDALVELGLTLGETVAIRIGKSEWTAPIAGTYSDVQRGERLVTVDSSGYIQCAINLESLAGAIGEDVNAPVVMKKASE